jgi:sortase A
MLAWSAWFAIDGMLFQWDMRDAFVMPPPHPDLSSYSPLPIRATATPLPAVPPRIGSAIATLDIPRIGLSAVVLHGSDDRTLRRGPGHLENTPLPGEPGNVVIAGHRDTFFRALGDVRAGDDIFVDSSAGRVRYRVTSTRVVNAHDLSVLAPTSGALLSLITCYPFWVLGPAPDRFVVRAARVDGPGPAELPAQTNAMPLAAPRPSVEPPAVLAPAPVEAPPASTVRALDDQALVRLAIDRFRAIYNARLISHHDDRRGGALRFDRCDVVFEGERAFATCRPNALQTDLGGSDVWTLTLERADGEWVIRSTMTSPVAANGSSS